jgi:gas vesicle protein
MNIPSWLRRWALAIGAVILTPIISNIITHITDPIVLKSLNESGNIIVVLRKMGIGWSISDLFSLLLTALIIGLIASWQVQKSKKETTKWKDYCRRLNEQLGQTKDDHQQKRMGNNITEGTHEVQRKFIAHYASDITTSEDLLFNEVGDALEKDDKKE